MAGDGNSPFINTDHGPAAVYIEAASKAATTAAVKNAQDTQKATSRGILMENPDAVGPHLDMEQVAQDRIRAAHLRIDQAQKPNQLAVAETTNFGK